MGYFRHLLMLLAIALSATVQPGEPQQTLTIQPLGTVSKSHLSEIQARLIEQHGLRVIIAKPQPLPQSTFYKPRNRYRADKLLEWLKARAKTDFILGVTSKDISTTLDGHEDWGIFGLGYMPGKAAVVSSYRLRKPGKNSTAERLARVASHEVGHNRGLPHCKSTHCLMADANGSIKNVEEEREFCRSCKQSLGR